MAKGNKEIKENPGYDKDAGNTPGAMTGHINGVIDVQYMVTLMRDSKHHDACQGNILEIAHMLFGLNEEVGEVNGIMKKITWHSGMNPAWFDARFNSDGWAPKLLDELGDVMWYYTQILRIFRLTSAEVKILNTLKLMDRHGFEWPFSTVSIEDARELHKRAINDIVNSREYAP